MKCANCDSNAAFEYRLTLSKSLFYCDKDLPGFLEPRKKAGLLKITEQYKEDAKSAIEVLTLPIPEIAEEVQAETPAPKKKKATAKKSVK
jgi:hypothetical protein